MGLPDLTPLHERCAASLLETMNGQVRTEWLENVMKSRVRRSDAGVAMWRTLTEEQNQASGTETQAN